MATLTANEKLRDALVRHQLGLMRFSAGIRRKIIKFLDQSESDVRVKMEQVLTNLANKDGVDIRTGTRASKRLDALLKAIGKLRASSTNEAFNALSSELKALVTAETGFATGVLSLTVPVILDVVTPPPERLRTLVTQSPFHGKTLGQWKASMEKADLDRIATEIKVGLVQGESTQSIVRRVLGTKAFKGSDGTTATTRRQASAIVRTSINHMATQARKEVFLANADIIDEELYVATLDSRTSAVCRGLDGQIFPLGKGPYPPVHINCRSLRVAIFDDQVIGQRPAKSSTEKQLLSEFSKDEGLKRTPASREGLPRGLKGKFDAFSRKRVRELTGRVPASQTYAEFLGNQSVGFQNDVLGITKARLFRFGKLPLDKFVDRRGGELSLRDLAILEKDAFKAAGLDPADFL